MAAAADSDEKGLVFNIQRFAIHDGPGIRTTVFLKGCPLRCSWCSNPESIKPEPEILVRDQKCIGCGKCAEVCVPRAIKMADKKRIIQRELCDSCLKCAEVCPSKSIERSGELKSPDQVMEVVLKDFSLCQRTGGGLTLSGGEPLLQARFCASVLKAAKQAGLHTALDTSGHADLPALSILLPHTDLLLYDLKHLDEQKHKQGTGGSNNRILENLRRVMAETQTTVWVRVPVIPGFNDSEKEIQSIAAFVKNLPRVPEKICLLPFHKFAGGKYQALGKKYAFDQSQLIPDRQMSALKKQIEVCGIIAELDA
jgi:pyruvate formate lyase activating enzyme